MPRRGPLRTGRAGFPRTSAQASPKASRVMVCCSDWTVAQSCSRVAVKIRYRDRATLSSWARQSMAPQSSTSSGPFTTMVSNVPLGSPGPRPRCSRAHLPTSAPFRARPLWVGIRPVPHDQPPGAAANAALGPVAFRRTGIRLLGILSRRWVSAPLTIGLPRRPLVEVTTRDPDEVSTFRACKHDRGGCPLYPEARGVPTIGSGSPIAACRLHQRPGPTTRIFVPSLRAFCDEASAGVHWRSPVRSSPRPVAPPDGTGALGLVPRASYPQQAGPTGACRGGDRSRTLIGNYAPGMTGLQPARSLHTRDLVSHTATRTTSAPRGAAAVVFRWR